MREQRHRRDAAREQQRERRGEQQELKVQAPVGSRADELRKERRKEQQRLRIQAGRRDAAPEQRAPGIGVRRGDFGSGASGAGLGRRRGCAGRRAAQPLLAAEPHEIRGAGPAQHGERVFVEVDQRIQAQRGQRELQQHGERAAPDARQRAAPAGAQRLVHREQVDGAGCVDEDDGSSEERQIKLERHDGRAGTGKQAPAPHAVG